MDSYLVLKFLHILSAVVVVGTGAGIAFFMYMANRSNNSQAISVTAKHVILGDWVFTMPAVVMQLVTGLLLMNKLGYSYSSTWFYWVISLFVFIGICWLPVIRIQYRLHDLAIVAIEKDEITVEFKQLMRLWTLLGIPALVATLIIFWLMVFKPFSVV